MEAQCDMNNANNDVVETVCDIVSAYVSNNTVPSLELVTLIEDVHTAVVSMSGAGRDDFSVNFDASLTPAVPINQSVQPEYIACLECGQRFKSLRKHLRTYHDLSPEEYKMKWALPSDYPMVCPDYAKRRSSLAKKIGLGKR
ncbi:MAG: MucR family transcriptional regulator [Hyphomicrobiales bacterium]